MTESRTRIRMKILAALVLFMFGALTTRLWFLQVLASDQFSNLADQNQVRLVPIEPVRGEILDRNGVVLVGNRPSTVVLVDQTELGDRADEVLYRLATVLKMNVQDIVDRLQSVRYLPYEPIPVAEDVEKQTIFYIGEHPDLFPGVSFTVRAVRSYPQSIRLLGCVGGDVCGLAAQILGYTGEISQDQLDSGGFAGYKPGDVVGKAGVEGTYERDLYGTPGTRGIRVNAQGRVLDDNFRSQPPVPGSNLVLSIDARAQALAEQSLSLGLDLAHHTTDDVTKRHLAGTGGAVVVMDPRNGQVLALASNPTYDPSIFLGGLTKREFAPLNDPLSNYPLLDRAIQSGYPPGSTFKPFVAAAGVKEGFVRIDGNYPCPPTYEVPGDEQHKLWHNWTTANYGYLSLAQSLVVSCDTIYYPMGSKFWAEYYQSGKRREVFQDYIRGMGFGRKTGVDLPAERSGVVPDAAYKDNLFTSNPKVFCVGSCSDEAPWYPGDYVNMSIGQGFMQVTPIQLAVGYSAIANGGTLLEPHVGLRVQRPDGTVVRKIEPVPMGRLPVSRKTVNFLRQALTGVPQPGGTAGFAFLGFPFDQVSVAAKTGTADVVPKQPYSWFAAMAPADHPRYVVVAMVEQGGHGSTTAAPVVRHILEGLFGLPTSKSLIGGSVAD